MPFGPKCEYEDFAACVRAHQDKDDPEAYCAKIMRETEGHCQGGGNRVRRLLKPADLVNLHRGQKSWFNIKNATGAKDDPAEIYIYGYIGWDVTAGEFIKEVQAITADKMTVRIATNGGDVFDGIAILNALRAHKAEVTTIVDSQALSAGSFIMQAGEQRLMMKNTTVMIHDALTGGAWAEGNAADLREFAKEVAKYADMLDQASDNIASIYAERAGGDQADWRKRMQDETWYTADAAIEVGLADAIYDPKASNTGPRVRNQEPPAVQPEDTPINWDDAQIDWDAALKEAAQ